MDDLKFYASIKERTVVFSWSKLCVVPQAIGMSFGPNMRRGRKVGNTGTELPDDKAMREIEEIGLEYYGILQLDRTLSCNMKNKISDGYVRRVKKKMNISKLNAGNIVLALMHGQMEYSGMV